MPDSGEQCVREKRANPSERKRIRSVEDFAHTNNHLSAVRLQRTTDRHQLHDATHVKKSPKRQTSGPAATRTRLQKIWSRQALPATAQTTIDRMRCGTPDIAGRMPDPPQKKQPPSDHSTHRLFREPSCTQRCWPPRPDAATSPQVPGGVPFPAPLPPRPASREGYSGGPKNRPKRLPRTKDPAIRCSPNPPSAVTASSPTIHSATTNRSAAGGTSGSHSRSGIAGCRSRHSVRQSIPPHHSITTLSRPVQDSPYCAERVETEFAGPPAPLPADSAKSSRATTDRMRQKPSDSQYRRRHSAQPYARPSAMPSRPDTSAAPVRNNIARSRRWTESTTGLPQTLPSASPIQQLQHPPKFAGEHSIRKSEKC